MLDDLFIPYSKPSEEPVYAVYQLKPGIPPSNHIEDYYLLGTLSAPTNADLLAKLRTDNWHTDKWFTPAADCPVTPDRQSTFGDLIGIPNQTRGYDMAQITDSPEGVTKLEPFRFDETPRQKLGPDSPKIEAEKIHQAPAAPKDEPKESPAKRKNKPKMPKP